MSDSVEQPGVYTDFDMNKVHVELEKLNIATDVINKLELQLDEARNAFSQIQNVWAQKLHVLSTKLGSCIEKSRPYYDARMKARVAQSEAQVAAQRFERANSLHSVAKQQVNLTQESLARQGTQNVDPACLEVLNHHIQRVNEAEMERLASEEEHRRIQQTYQEAIMTVSQLEKELKRSIAKSKTYFDSRVEFTKVLENQKELIERLEAEIKQKKIDYANGLKRLEQMSEEIHQMRQLGTRAPGVGSETPGPPVSNPVELGVEESLPVSVRKAPPDELNLTDSRKIRAASVPVDPGRLVAAIEGKSGLSEGIILLAHQLSEYDMIIGGDTRVRAFSFPPDLDEISTDCHYRTQPDGVKPLPTPPVSPVGPVDHQIVVTSALSKKVRPVATVPPTTKTVETANSGGGATPKLPSSPQNLDFPMIDGSDTLSDTSSVVGVQMEDDHIDALMKSPNFLIAQINGLQIDSESHERSSASGQEDV